MIRSLFAAALVATIASAAPAGPCRDAKGHFAKCPPAAPVAGTRCKDAKGRFAKCGTPGAVPAKK